MKLWLLIVLIAASCKTVNSVQDKKHFKSDKLYLVCRGTTTKSALIAQKFNLKDTNITHCGLGFYAGNEFKIYNVIDNSSKEGSALVVDNFESFTKQSFVYYASLWQINLSAQQVSKIKSICERYAKEKIWFDYNFKLNNELEFYCSEFCATVLKESNIKELDFGPSTTHLKEDLCKSVLKREALVYYPVDFFEKNSNFKKVYEWRRAK